MKSETWTCWEVRGATKEGLRVSMVMIHCIGNEIVNK